MRSCFASLTSRFSVASSALVLVPLLLSGCGSEPAGPEMFSVTGSVTFDGAPVEDGRIQFRKASGDQKAFSSEIKAGAYKLEAEAGTMQVEITASRPSGKFDTSNPDDPPQPIGEMYIPAKYNAETTLTAEIKDSGENVIPFELTGK